jgi:hypothetical protein
MEQHCEQAFETLMRGGKGAGSPASGQAWDKKAALSNRAGINNGMEKRECSVRVAETQGA